MKVAVLGSNGFVGSSISAHLESQGITTINVNRSYLNLLNYSQVKSFLEKNKFDAIINCAAVMTDFTTVDDTINNLTLFMNFFSNSNLFGKFINIGSGAEYDRTQDIFNIREEEIFFRLPKDSYGYGQNMKSRLSYEKSNFFNLRIFNCFGKGELSSRIFPRLFGDAPFFISDDRFFDFFFIDDLKVVVSHYLHNNDLEKDVNCVYEKKLKISEVVNLFCELNELNKSIHIESTSEKNYTGDYSKLKSLGIELKGLEYGFNNYR